MGMLSTGEEENENPTTTETNGDTPNAPPEEEPEVLAAENGTTTMDPCHEELVEKVKMKLKDSDVSELQSFLGSLDDSPQEVMTALLDALFGDVVKGFSKEVFKKKNYLAAVTQEEGSQILLLHAINSLCRKSSTDSEMVKEVALVLKTLYDADVLEEEYIVQWYQEGLTGGENNSQIWRNTKSFTEWLQITESESESEPEPEPEPEPE